MAKPKYKYDYFISYTKANVEDARWIAQEIQAAGYSTWYQDTNQTGSVAVVHGYHAKIDASHRVLALDSRAYAKTDHCQAEWARILTSDPLNKRHRLVRG